MQFYRKIMIITLLVGGDILCFSLLMVGNVLFERYVPQIWGRCLASDFLQLSQTSYSVSMCNLVVMGVIALPLFLALSLMGAYKTPRRWFINEALPTIIKSLGVTVPFTLALFFSLYLGSQASMLQPQTLGVRLVCIWVILGIGLTGLRLLLGYGQQELYRRGIGLEASLIVGDSEAAHRLSRRLQANLWLGEQVIGYLNNEGGPLVLGTLTDLLRLSQQYQLRVIWLAPSKQPVTFQFPPLFFEPGGAKFVWRILPTDFEQLHEFVLKQLSYEQRAIFYNRLQHDLALPAMRVVMLGSRGVPANYSGIETYVEEVGHYLVENGLAVSVYCHHKYVSRRGQYRGMDLRFMPTIRTKHLETIVHTFLGTIHALLREDEIFHYHALGPCTLAWLPRLWGRKVVSTVQGLDWERAKWGPVARFYLKLGEQATIYLPHTTIVVSKTLVNHYQQYYGKQPIYIPNGFEAPQPKQPNHIKKLGLDKDSYILFVGRLSPEKGCHTLIKAFVELETDKQLILAGRATYENGYYQQLQEIAEATNRVHFIGFVQGEMLQELYANAYIVVHPSEIEGLSISLLEALSYGNCLLVSDIPENLEAIQDAGCHFQAGDKHHLTSQLQLLLSQPHQVEKVRHLARQKASHKMTWPVVAEKTQEVYKALLLKS